MAAKLALLTLAALAVWDILTGRNPADLIPLRVLAALGIRSRCCGARVSRPFGWPGAYCSACHWRLR